MAANKPDDDFTTPADDEVDHIAALYRPHRNGGPKRSVARKPHARRFVKLTDHHIRALCEFSEDSERVMLWDARVHGLRIRISPYRATWTFFRQHKRRGKRDTTHRVLGYWSPIPGEGMPVADARKAAEALRGRMAEGHVEPSKKSALTFDTAFADYCAYLSHKVESANSVARRAYEDARRKNPNPPPPVYKEPLWDRVVTGLGKLYLTPKWAGWTLADISRSPEEVRDWHRDVSKRAGAVTGNKVAKILRATYRYAARLRRDLPPELPTSGVTMNVEEPRDAAMTEHQHRQWGEAWQRIESPTRKAYQLLAILSGQRPGELARLKVSDVDFERRRFIIRKAKASNDIIVPMSAPIEEALRMAIRARDGAETDWLFPAREGGHIRKFDGDGLPLWGNGLRHNYKTIATAMQIDEALRDILQGHTPKGVARKYVSKIVLAEGQALADAQARISDRIKEMVGLT